jgi:hypothetical protein
MAAETEYATVGVWVVVDAPGDHAVGADEDAALEAYEENVGGHRPRRVVKVTLRVPLPRPRELAATLPDDQPGPAALAVGPA